MTNEEAMMQALAEMSEEEKQIIYAYLSALADSRGPETVQQPAEN